MGDVLHLQLRLLLHLLLLLLLSLRNPRSNSLIIIYPDRLVGLQMLTYHGIIRLRKESTPR